MTIKGDMPLPVHVEKAMDVLATGIWALPASRHQEWRNAVDAVRAAVRDALSEAYQRGQSAGEASMSDLS